MTPSPLLAEFLQPITEACERAPALDLACGKGRNGLYLAEHGIEVVFADRNAEALASVQSSLLAMHGSKWRERASTWQVDLEIPGVNPLPEAAYGAILVFRYLHRPLMPAIARALKLGGVLVYETFTTEQRQFGRPTNPDYLLRAGELLEHFAGWEVLGEFEGIVGGAGVERAVGWVVVRKSE